MISFGGFLAECLPCYDDNDEDDYDEEQDDNEGDHGDDNDDDGEDKISNALPTWSRRGRPALQKC